VAEETPRCAASSFKLTELELDSRIALGRFLLELGMNCK
jgi:hypothetical protein